MRDYGECVAEVKGVQCREPAIVKKLKLCNAHYLQQKSSNFKGFKTPRNYMPGVRCSAPGCKKTYIAKGLCTKHYQQDRDLGAVFPEGFPVRARGVVERDSEGRKKCARCEVWKMEEEFYGGRLTQDELSSSCKQCHLERIIARQYGLSPEDFERLVSQQGGGCGVCGRQDAKGLVVDHDHSCCPGVTTCGECIRGVLCSPCNLLLGRLGDSREDLIKTAEKFLRYLEKEGNQE